MSNKLMIRRKSILSRILSKIKGQRTKLELNIELYNFLKERYAEEKRIIGIIPIIVFGQEQLDKITGLDISGEDYIKTLRGIEELRNLKELYCRLGVEFDYDSVCEALNSEQLQIKRLSIKNPKQLDGYNLAKLPTDVMIVGYDCTKKYEINNGKIIEKRASKINEPSQIIDPNMKTISHEDSLIDSERIDEYNKVMEMWGKFRKGEVSLEDVKQVICIAFGEGSIESEQLLNAIIDSGKIGERTADRGERKYWKLEPEEAKRIRYETAESAQIYIQQESDSVIAQGNSDKNKQQARS